jgi:hypothetical protein
VDTAAREQLSVETLIGDVRRTAGARGPVILL